MAKKFVFIKTETSSSGPWADVAETFGSFYDATTVPAAFDASKIQDYSQVINSYVKIQNKVRLATSGDDITLGMSIANPTDATAGNHVIDFELITSSLDSGFKAVYFGFDFGGQETVSEMDVVNGSVYFGRRLDGRLVELKTNKEFGNSITAAMWFAAYKLIGLPFYYVVFNPNLVDLTATIDKTVGETTFRTLNSHDGSFKDAAFSPSFSNKLIKVGDNVLAALASEFTIKPFGNSVFQYMDIPADVMSKLILRADAVGATVTVRDNELDVKLTGNSAVVSFSWPVGSENWGATPNSDQLLRRSYLITKLG